MMHAYNPASATGGFRLRTIVSWIAQMLPTAAHKSEPASNSGPSEQRGARPAVSAPEQPPPHQREPFLPDTDDRQLEPLQLRSLEHGFDELALRLDRTAQELTRLVSGKCTSAVDDGRTALAAATAPLAARLDELHGHLTRIESALPAVRDDSCAPLDSIPGLFEQLTEILQAGFKGQRVGAKRLQAEFQSSLAQLREQLAPRPSEVGETSPPANEWRRALFGESLSADQEFAPRVEWVCENMLAGNSAASTFVGQLLIYRHAPSERRPPLLKDLGEAFYRCFPKYEDVEDSFEKSLISWLQTSCEQAGLLNRIEVVHPGERFDPTRHTALEKGGVEVAQVHGWVVLGDRDRVYTKALVSIR